MILAQLVAKAIAQCEIKGKLNMSIKTKLAIAICKSSYRTMRLLGRTGRALPGKLALKVQPQLMSVLSEGHNSIVITGTNGKTTTTHIIQQAILNAYGSAAYDPTSTNLSQGVATTLCLDSTVGGKRKSDWAVIESDEGATKRILPALKPKVLVVTNLYQDQVDRYSSLTTARDYIIEAVKTVPDTILVLDADCQVVASIADEVPNKVVWFGVECDIYNEGIADYDEHVTCVKCGSDLNFGQRSFAHLGNFECPSCGYKHHKADFAITKITDRAEKSCKLEVRNADGKVKTIPANIRAGYDVYNAIAAIAGLNALSVEEEVIDSSLAHFVHAAHRFEIFDVDGTQVRLLLMKNTAGCNQLINMLVSEQEPPQNLVCLLGAEIMDGLSTEWIKDINWEKLCGANTHVIIGGPKHEDMAARLKQAGVAAENMRTQTSYSALVDDLAKMNEPVTVIANCSTLEALRLELVKKYKPLDYWSE